MRQRGAIPGQSRVIRAIWPLPGVALSLVLAFSSLPFGTGSILAAPPEPSTNVEEDDPVASNDAPPSDDTESAQLDLLPDETDTRLENEDSAIGNRTPGFESIRRRGLEAPVQLRQPDPEAPVAEEADKGDGEPRQDRSTSDSETEKKESAKRSSPQRGIRVWPMRANSYSFTQAFGCTQQIANFYLPDAGCPASAPVVHSGVDLAAPEGTPFYAAASGWVTGSGYDREVGVPNTRIIIQHDGRNEGYATEYLHWIASFVEVGDYVEAGEQIGEVGSVGYSTGPHLHFSVVDLGSSEHVDPVRWLPDEPGSTGYRGIRPNTRAGMRLPAGTTAGVPEWEDPNPPPPPEREDVPESPQPEKDKGKNKDSSGENRKQHRKERRAEKRDAAKDDQTTDESATASETADDDTVSEVKDKERTRKRERNKDGQQSENAEKGEDGGRKKTKGDESNSSGNGKSNKGRHGKGNGNGNHRQNDKRDDEKVKQHKTNDKGSDNAQPIDGSEDDGNSDGDQTGAEAPQNDAAGTDASGDTSTDQTASNANDDAGGEKSNGTAKEQPEASEAQSASGDDANPARKSKRRKQS